MVPGLIGAFNPLMVDENMATTVPGPFASSTMNWWSTLFSGALENMQMRTSWDSAYTQRDVMRNLLGMFMAVRAAYAGRVELTEEWEAVAGLVDRLAAGAPQPPGPPGTT